MSPELEQLLEWAKDYKPTPEQKRAALISLAWGNAVLDGCKLTKEDVEKAAEELWGKP